MLKERIVYLGMPLFSSDDIKQQVGFDVTQLIIAQLLYLQFDDPENRSFSTSTLPEPLGIPETRSVLKLKPLPSAIRSITSSLPFIPSVSVRQWERPL